MAITLLDNNSIILRLICIHGCHTNQPLWSWPLQFITTSVFCRPVAVERNGVVDRSVTRSQSRSVAYLPPPLLGRHRLDEAIVCVDSPYIRLLTQSSSSSRGLRDRKRHFACALSPMELHACGSPTTFANGGAWSWQQQIKNTFMYQKSIAENQGINKSSCRVEGRGVRLLILEQPWDFASEIG